jgi:glycine/D-amino acid oxidase-like deaminating enzyme
LSAVPSEAQVVICGAGIAGVSAAYHLATRHAVRDILLVDERPPLSLTSDKSTECYRNWWPGPDPAMVSLMNRSIDILEQLARESGNVFHLNRRGYLYLTADPQGAAQMLASARVPPALGAGELRIHRGQPDDPAYIPSPVEGYQEVPGGADLFLDADLLHRYFPYLSSQVVAGLHVRRAGWFSAQQLGAYLLEQARQHGVRLLQGRVTGVQVAANQVRSVYLEGGAVIRTTCFVNAAGPFLRQVGSLLGLDLPVENELHLKVALHDTQGVVPRPAPLLIWNDPQSLPWSAEERTLLAETDDMRWLLGEMPGGAHTRPEGGADSDIILLLWEYRSQLAEPLFPPPLDEAYPEIALRGLAAMLPGMRAYFPRLPRPMLDGGYYTKTRENRPLIGPLPVEGAYVIGALSGFGLMVSCAAGELLAAHLTGSALPAYAPAFALERYADPAYLALLEGWGDSGQL